MSEQTRSNSHDSLINLLFDDGLQNAIPKIIEILMNTAMLLERVRHIGAHQLSTPWQSCQFHLQKNAQEYVTKLHLKKKVTSDIKVIFNADDRAHAEERLHEFVKTYSESQPKLATWGEENLPEGFTVFALPEAHNKRIRTSNACENVNGQIKKNAPVLLGSFPARSHY